MWTMPAALVSTASGGAGTPTQWFLDNFTGAATTVYFNDTFTGTGNLSAHTSDSGQSWTTVFSGRTTLSGGYLAIPAGLNDRADVTSDVTPVGGSFTLEFTFDLTAGAWESRIAIYTHYTGVVSDPHVMWTLIALASGSLQITGAIPGGATFIDQTVSAPTVASHVVKLVVTNSSQSLYYDGSLLTTSSQDLSARTARRLSLTLSSDNTSGTNLLRLKPNQLRVTDGVSGDLSAHAPDVGGAYSSDGGALTSMALDGAGNLQLPATNSYATSLAQPSATTYSLSWTFTLDAIAANGAIDMALVEAAGNSWNLEPYLSWASGEIDLQIYYRTNVTNYSVYAELTSRFTIGSPHTMKAYVAPSGTIVYYDDVIVGALRGVPNAFDHVEFGLSGSGSVDAVEGAYDTAPDTIAVAGAYFFQDTFTGSASALELHAPDVGHAYAHGANHQVDGSGFLSARTPGGTDFAVSYSGPTGTSYSFVVGFTIGVAAPTGRSISLEVSLQDPDTDHRLVQWSILFDTANWQREGSIELSTGPGSVGGGNDTLASIATGAHTFAASVTPSGTTFLFDDVVLWTTTEVPDVPPLGVLIFFNGDNTTDMKLDYINGLNSAYSPPVVFVNDTFTGTNGTLIAAHTGEIGATWTRQYTFSDVNWQIESNTLQLADTAGSLPDHRMHASGSGGPDCYVEAGFICSGATYFQFELLARGTGSNDISVQFTAGSGGFNEVAIGYTGGGSGGTDVSPSTMSVANGTHTARIDCVGNTVTAYWDGVQVAQATNMTTLTAAGLVGMAMHMISDAITAVSIDYFKAGDL